MESKLAKNIRDHRKRLGLTQDQLAERLQITLGTVSKWERGSSEPDLGYIMDLAELFHISVDALIGFSMHGSNADEEAERIENLINKLSFEEMEAECENALKKFPNHFRTALLAASCCKSYGTLFKDEAHIKRALELYRHALELISQNRDPEINEVVLRNEIAGCYSELKDHKKAIDEYKKNNLSGSNNAVIGLLTIMNDINLEEGIEYTEKAHLNNTSEFITIMSAYCHYFWKTGNASKGIQTAEWAIEHLRKTKEDPDKLSFLDKLISMFYLYLSLIQYSYGQMEASEKAMQIAVETASSFDASPLYTLENIAYIKHLPQNVYVYDDVGPTAVDGLRLILDESGDLVPQLFREKLEKEISSISRI